MVAVAAIAGTAVAGIAGSAISSSAAGSAADTQAAAANRAADLQMQQYYQTRADLQPWRTAGSIALSQLGGTSDFVPGTALDPGQYGYQAPAVLDPNQYAFRPPSGQDVLTQDPGYQFRLQQGQLALDRAASAKGQLLSGGQLKAQQQFGQDLASQEYQNAYQRGLTQNQLGYERAMTGNEQTYQRGLAANQLGYGRALQQNQDIYGRQLQAYGTNLNRLQSIAGLGQTAVGQGVQAGEYAATNIGAATQAAGAAQAAGTVGAANAWSQGLGSIGGAANNYLNYQLLSSLVGKGAGAGGFGYSPTYGYGAGLNPG
jgi:hypothetical protein